MYSCVIRYCLYNLQYYNNIVLFQFVMDLLKIYIRKKGIGTPQGDMYLHAKVISRVSLSGILYTI